MLTKRFFALAVALLLLLTVLSGCGTKSSSKLTVDTNAFLDLGEGYSLDGTKLSAIASMLAATYASDFDTQEMLIAAYRGYDMLAENFDESSIDPTVVPGFNQAAVAKLIETANAKAGNDSKIYFEEYKSINEKDTLAIIRSLQTRADLDASKGIIDQLLGWIGAFIGWMTKTLCFDSYIGGICLFAVIVELLMLPLSIKQQKNSIKQAKLRPKEMAIKKKYAGRDDQVTKQKMNQELQELYQRENVNAAAGCLPLLIQLPILLALYRIVIDPLHYVLGQASTLSNALYTFFTASPAAGGLGRSITDSRGTITMLSELTQDNLARVKDFMYFSNGQEIFDRIQSIMPKMPDFTLGNVNLGANPSFDGNYILLLIPALTFVVYFFSMRLSKKFTYQSQMVQDQQTACSSWLMDIYMPGMSTFFAFMVPALVGIYWMFKSVISTLRQFIVCRLMPYPQFTEEDYRAAEREYAGKPSRKQEPAGSYTYGKNVQMVDGRPKSLFHMDDDDYVAKVNEELERQKDAKDNSAQTTTTQETVDGVALKQYDRPAREKKSKKKDDAAEQTTETSDQNEQ